MAIDPLTRVLSWHNSRSTTHSLAPRFTDKWKARLRHSSVPPEALPPALKRKFDNANENKERYRRASSSYSLAVARGVRRRRPWTEGGGECQGGAEVREAEP